MKTYELLEHTADLKIRCFGKDMSELFAHAALGMFSQIYEGKAESRRHGDHEITRKINIQSIDLESLLVDFLSELLSLSDEHNEIYYDFHVKINNHNLQAKVKGRKVKDFSQEIKAVTYHELKIEKKNGMYRAEIVFDI